MRYNIPVPAFERFCIEIAPNALKYINNSGSHFEGIPPMVEHQSNLAFV